MGAGKWVPRDREYTLRLKREIRESQLAYARSVGDARMVAECERALGTIAKWERGCAS